MKKSITIKLFLLTAILLSVFLLFTMIFQLVFFEKFYIKARMIHISENTLEFISNYNACKDVNEAVSNLVDRFELKNDAALILFDKEMNPVHISENENSINLINKRKLIDELKNKIIFENNGLSDETNFVLAFSPSDDGIRGDDITYYINIFSVNDNEIAFVCYTHKEMSEAEDAIYALYQYFIAASAAVILILSVFYARLIARPLVKLNQSASRISEMDFTKRIEIKGDDEIGRLGATLCFLSHNLNTALCDLKEANSMLQNDIDKEKQLNKMHKDFIATISHELKTPLALIKGYAQAFHDHIVREDSTDYYSEVILDETGKMSDLITRMLVLTELESEYVRINEDKFCISALADYVVTKFTPLAAVKKICISNKLSGTQLICADRKKMEQVIENLLTNAIKHTPEGGTISIWAESHAVEMIFNIENTGSHIPGEEIDSIWDMFYRGKQNSRKDGSGLGLAIAKKVFELHNMKYGVRNTESGVCFFFMLERFYSTPIN
jgi:signal transduction histidine kinase